MRRAERLARLGALTGRLARAAVGGRVAEALASADERARVGAARRLAQADELVRALGQLKGAAMKVGQQLAVAADSLDMPLEVRARLGALLDDAAPAPFATIVATVERELDAPVSTLFATLDPTPLGSASLGQAHAATLPDGTEVVVKVQHEGIADALEADLAALRALLLGGRLVGRSRAEIDDVYDEVAAHLRRELDYLQEAVHLTAFADRYGEDPRLCLPRPIPSHSAARVLTMTRVSGAPLDAFVTTATPEARQRAGRTLADWFFESTFHHGLLHADPHAGNFLFQPDGRVGVLDFGCVKRFDPFFLGTYARAVLGALDGDQRALLDACADLGVWSRGDPGAGEAIAAFCEAALGPWRHGETTIGHEEDLVRRCVPASRELWRYPEIRGARDMVYLHRTLAGLYAMARALEVRAPWGDLLRAHLRHAIAVAEGRGHTVTG